MLNLARVRMPLKARFMLVVFFFRHFGEKEVSLIQMSPNGVRNILSTHAHFLATLLAEFSKKGIQWRY